ncbi:MAG: mobilization protein C [Rhodospirillales bacterium]|nr:mobilization protein C [Rhodospirillales bacterium]
MANLSLEDRIEKHRKKLDQLLARQKAISARTEERHRKADTRRKILVGACDLDEAEKTPMFKQKLMFRLDQFLSRDADRALFDLPPRNSVSPETSNPT